MDRFLVWWWPLPGGGEVFLGTDGTDFLIVVERDPGGGVLDLSGTVAGGIDAEVEGRWDRFTAAHGAPAGPFVVAAPPRRVRGAPPGWVEWVFLPAAAAVLPAGAAR